MTMMYNPPHPGEFIFKTYLEPLDVSIRDAARKLAVSPSTFARLISGKSNVSPIMAMRLSKAFGRTPESWMQMQANYDLWSVRDKAHLEKVSVIYAHA
ncbi:HigA family addiction module antitoxin [Legionella pneumophila]|uniref:HigA family addiction module antitoxin n=1 Tax=Legionella pneumophila TaxID=446 RepID=UPI000A3EF200|nr:HigA family addiction module antitoxin [Legionella pneumophila]